MTERGVTEGSAIEGSADKYSQDEGANKEQEKKERNEDIEAKAMQVPYDKLAVAVGCNPQTFGTPGMKDNTFFLKDAPYFVVDAKSEVGSRLVAKRQSLWDAVTMLSILIRITTAAGTLQTDFFDHIHVMSAELTTETIQLLEKACYNFGAQTLNQTVEQLGWDCAEAAELNRWPRVFLDNQDKFLQADLDGLRKSFAQILDSIVQLRHTAVHGLRINANRLEQFMIDAESLARFLRDDYYLQSLTRPRMDTQITIGELKRNKDLLEAKVTLKLRSIAAQRARLDCLEKTAVDEMLKEDKEYQILAGADLDQAINSPDTVRQSEASSEMEVSSETDSEAELEAELVPVTSCELV